MKRNLCYLLLPCLFGGAAQAAVLNYDQLGLSYSLLIMDSPKVNPKGLGVYAGHRLLLNNKGGGIAIIGGYETLDNNSDDYQSFGFAALPTNASGQEPEEIIINQKYSRYYLQAEFFEPITRYTDMTLALGLMDQHSSADIRTRMDNETDENPAYDVTSSEYQSHLAKQKDLSYGAYYYQLGIAQSLGDLGNLSLGWQSEQSKQNQDGYWLSLIGHTDAPVDLKFTYKTLGDNVKYEFSVLLNF